DAARFAAQVVKGQVIRNRSDEARVRPAVREQGRLVDAETGVSRREEASGPEPAPVLLLIDFGPEPGIVIAVDEGHLGWRPVLLPAPIVLVAPASTACVLLAVLDRAATIAHAGSSWLGVPRAPRRRHVAGVASC